MIGWLSSSNQGAECKDDLRTYSEERRLIEHLYRNVEKADIKCPDFLDVLILEVTSYKFLIGDPVIAFQADIFEYSIEDETCAFKQWNVKRYCC